MPGRHAAAQPKRARRAPRRTLPWRGIALVALGCVLIAALAVGVRVFITGESAAAGQCEPGSSESSVSLVVTPEMSDVVKGAADELNERGIDGDDGCVHLDVETSTAAAMLQAVQAGSAELPDLWIPDASTWLTQLPRDVVPDDARIRKFAKTPIVLVGHEGAERPDSWLSALTSGGATMLDPRDSSAGVGTLAAVHGESVTGVTTGTELAAWMVSAAQKSDGAPDKSEGALLDRAIDAGSSEPAFFPSTEQRFLRRIGADADLPITALVPKTGSVLLDYPLAVLGGDDAEAAFAALGDYLGSADGQQALAESGFRPPSGKAAEDSLGVGDVTELGLVDASGVDRLLRQWVTLSVRSRMLAVIDVSGSMAESVGDKTRIQLAVEAAIASLQFMPDDAQVGVWAFSIGLGQGSNDYREVVPVRQLGATSRGQTHREAITAGAQSLAGLVGGGTALYDSTLAAYRTAKANYDPARSNSVVVLTDGRNEDPDGLSLDQLLGALEREMDPATPIQIVTIGMGPEADTRALQRISELTGARSYVADDPRDIGTIFTNALLERVGWGLR